MICEGPWATDTQLLGGVREAWVKNNLPLNMPLDVAKYIIQVSADSKAHGQALYVTGGAAVDMEEGLNKTEPLWLGEKHSRDLNAGQVILGLVSLVCSMSRIDVRCWIFYKFLIYGYY